MRRSEFDGAGIAGVGMAQDTHARIAVENALKTTFGRLSAVGNNDHPGVLRETDTDTATVVDGHP